MATYSRLFAIFTQGNNFGDFLFAFLYIKPLLENVFPHGNELVHEMKGFYYEAHELLVTLE